MFLEEIKNKLNNLFDESLFSTIFEKKWFFNDKILVLEFRYNNLRFAYDISYSNNGFVLDFIDRDRKILDGDEYKKRISSELEYSCLSDLLKENIEEIKNKIDNSYDFLISVIVPVYNREKIISNCVESINSQTLEKKLFEVIFVDDCSIDSTVTVINKFISKDINYKILNRPVGSGNASAPRNEGIKSAKGKYIFFLDSDDTINSDLLQDGLNCAQKNNSDLIYFKLVSGSGRLVPIRPYKFGDVQEANLIKNHLMRSLSVFKLFNKEMLVSNKILFNPSITVAEDKVFMLESLCVARKVSILANKPYYSASLHDGAHLSRSQFGIDNMFDIINFGFLKIYSINRSEKYSKALYNAWLIIALEQVKKLILIKSYSFDKKKKEYDLIFSICSLKFEWINEQYIYKDVLGFLPVFKSGDFNLVLKYQELK